LIKGSKGSDSSLVSNENLNETFLSSARVCNVLLLLAALLLFKESMAANEFKLYL